MILNGLTQFSLASAALRLLLCAVMIGAAVLSWRRRSNPDARHGAEVLATMLALLMGGLALLSWPLYFATLQSYVDQWPGTMCIYGVLHVGGGIGESRWIPVLAEAIVWLKPLVALALGAWWVAHLLNRSTQHGQLDRTVFALVCGLGLICGVDATLEGSYLLSPKAEASPSPGCCVVQFSTAHSQPGSWSERLRQVDPNSSSAVFFLGTIGLAVALWTLGGRSKRGALLANFVAALGLCETAFAWVFISRALTPLISKDPRNFCLYDLLPISPSVDAGGALLIAGVVLLLCGRFALVLGPQADDTAAAQSLSRRLFRTASVCLMTSAVLLAICFA
jgi:hypothetical protein